MYVRVCEYATMAFTSRHGDNNSLIRKATCAEPKVNNISSVEIVASRDWCFHSSAWRCKIGWTAQIKMMYNPASYTVLEYRRLIKVETLTIEKDLRYMLE
jgi:hypothetical protein